MPATHPSQHLVTTRPRRSNCHRCRRVVLDGLDGGWPYRIDPIPLNLLGELHARQAGRKTYRLITDRFILREGLDIAADTKRGRPPVAAAHHCAPPDPAHIEPAHAPRFLELAADPIPVATDDQDRDQHALLVVTGQFAGARVIAAPADDEPAPF